VLNYLKDYAQYSFWLETAGDSLVPRPALQRSSIVDVAILGGGYSGLWTAYYLLRANPGLQVAVLEKEIVGFGASGRNGGWCSSRFPVTPAVIQERYGAEVARQLILAMFASVDEVGRICTEEGITADFRKGGILSLARGSHQLPMIQASYAAYKRLGLGDHFKLLTAEECNERVRVTNVQGGLYTAEGASLHPGRLVRGLAAAVERRGGAIYENTEVTNVRPGADARLITPSGELRARRAILLAGEAYLTRLRQYHRTLLPMYSLISLTEPLKEQQWTEISWQNHESLASSRYTVDYLTRTMDGRILFGSRGAPYAFGSRISDQQDVHQPTFARVHHAVVEWFPALRGIQFTHNWGGPVGVPRDWMPTVRFDPASRLGMICGYTGQGVATSNLAGRLLASLVAVCPSELEKLPLSHHRSPDWEMEPLRWLVVRYMQSAFLRIDESLEAGRPRPRDARVAETLGRH
jgi:glycine/D-amino acid oxidase-like deaminating enzyme